LWKPLAISVSVAADPAIATTATPPAGGLPRPPTKYAL